MSAPAMPDAADRRVLDYLREQWDELFHLTTIGQALATVGLTDDEVARRWRLADYLLAHPEIHPAVHRWGAPTLILTEAEKLLGRYLAACRPRQPGELRLADAAAALGRDPPAVADDFAALVRLGLLAGVATNDVLRWAFAPAWEQRLGPLGFTFHTVSRQSGERFGVP